MAWLMMILLLFFYGTTRVSLLKASTEDLSNSSVHLFRPAGTSVQLTCVSQKSQRSQIIWFKNDSLINCSSASKKNDRCKNHLELRNLTASESGTYTCHYNGSKIKEYHLEVVERSEEKPPELSLQENVTVNSGLPVVLQCTVHSELPLRTHWLRRLDVNLTGDNIVNYDGISYRLTNHVEQRNLEENQYISEMTIPTVQQSDAGYYICLAINRAGSTLKGTHLFVNSKLEKGISSNTSINLFPVKNLTMPVGGILKLTCLQTEPRKLRVSWFKNGNPINCSETGKYGHCKNVLFIRNLTPNDTGTYSCLGKNYTKIAGYALEVIGRSKEKPTMLEVQPENTTAISGSTIILQCKIHSEMPPTIQWLRHLGHTITLGSSHIEYNGDMYEIVNSSKHVNLNDTTFLSKLNLPLVREHDSGFYICLAANNAGYTYRGAYLTVVSTQESRLVMQGSNIPLSFLLPIVLLFIPLIIGLCYLHYDMTRSKVNCKTNKVVPSKRPKRKHKKCKTDEYTYSPVHSSSKRQHVSPTIYDGKCEETVIKSMSNIYV